LNMHEPFIYKLVDTLGEILGQTFPEIVERKKHIAKVIHAEEQHFNRTLDRGLEIFDKIKADLHNKNHSIIPGEDVFKLYDTYGFPVDLTHILAGEADLKIDMVGFEREMKKQQERARKAAKFQSSDVSPDSWIVLMENGATNFVGYKEDAIETHIVKYSVQKDKLNIVLRETPFYAEAGGQIGDIGIIAVEGYEVKVLDTQKRGNEIIHVCELPENFKLQSDRVLAQIDTYRRRQTEKNHSATHLLHAALRKVLGDHVQQAGSLVEPGRLRFDFTHHSKLNEKELMQIEQIINEKIQEDLPLEIAQDIFENARKRGAIALFGESSIASNTRRIEALTGSEAVKYLQQTRSRIQKMGQLLNAKDEEIIEKTQDLLESKRQVEKELEKVSSHFLSAEIEDIIKSAEIINGISVIVYKRMGSSLNQMKELGDKIREHAHNTVALLGTKSQGKLNFVCVVTDDLIKNKNLDAGSLIRQVAQVAGGSGGGRPHLATAGGKIEDMFDQAMEKIKELI